MANNPTGRETGAAVATETSESSLLDQVWTETVKRPQVADPDAPRKGMQHLLQELIRRQGDDEEELPDVDLDALESMIDEIDQRLGSFMDGILHHDEFQQLESSWRSLEDLVASIDMDSNVFIDVLNVSKNELAEDFRDYRRDITDSGLYYHVYKEHMGTYGGEPYGAIIGNYEFGSASKDVDLMRSIAKVSAMSHAPFITGANPEILGLDHFSDLSHDKGFKNVFEGNAEWQEFRESDENSRYVGMTLPRYMLRAPYSDETATIRNFRYTEAAGKDLGSYCWGNSAFAFGANMVKAFGRSGWCLDIVGPRSGGNVEDLPVHKYERQGRTETMSSTGTSLPDQQDEVLSGLGFTSLITKKSSNQACFFRANSMQKTREFGNTKEGHQQALDFALGTKLPYLFMITRIAHGLKVNQRMDIGSWTSRNDLEARLNEWLRSFVSDMQNPDQKTRSERPFRRAKVYVRDHPTDPGQYLVDMELMPHYKFDGADFTLSLSSVIDSESSQT